MAMDIWLYTTSALIPEGGGKYHVIGYYWV